MTSERGQSLIEYSVIIAVTIAALVTMQVYVKRGFQGKLRQAADSIGEQYAPKRTTGNSTLRMSSAITTTSTLESVSEPVGAGRFETVKAMRTTVSMNPGTPDTVQRTGEETVQALGPNVWQD